MQDKCLVGLGLGDTLRNHERCSVFLRKAEHHLLDLANNALCAEVGVSPDRSGVCIGPRLERMRRRQKSEANLLDSPEASRRRGRVEKELSLQVSVA
jgi:hypothetical protein